MANRYCRHCGQELSEDSSFCPNCGKPIQETAHVPTPEADVPVPPPPRQQVWETATPPSGQTNTMPQRRSNRFWVFVGSAIVIVVLLLGAMVTALNVGGGGSQSSIPSFGGSQSADEVLQGLKDNDMPIGESVAYTAKNDPNELLGRPNQYTSKVNFTDTRLKPDPTANKIEVENGGSIEVFEDESDAIARAKYLRTLTKSFSPLAEYSYRKGTVLLRLSYHLTPDQAAEYEDTLKDVL